LSLGSIKVIRAERGRMAFSPISSAKRFFSRVTVSECEISICDDKRVKRNHKREKSNHNRGKRNHKREKKEMKKRKKKKSQSEKKEKPVE
jgi:hypothetical protein